MLNLKEGLVKEIVEKIIEEGEVEKIVIFGSSVRDDYSSLSDIDIAIFGAKNLKVGVLKEKLNEELRTLRNIDIVLFDNLKNEDLKRKILEEGVVIYERGSSG